MIKVFINNTRTFGEYSKYYHHHDLMLANGCMAGVYDDQNKVEIPEKGDIVALYANGLGIVAYGVVTDEIVSLDDERVGCHPTKLRKLDKFRLMAYPIHHSAYETSNTQTLQNVKLEVQEFLDLLNDRALPKADKTLFSMD